jgi:hypothetical protein
VNTVWIDVVEPPIEEFLPELETAFGDLRTTKASEEKKESKPGLIFNTFHH